ncbi:hypothetical protein JCM10207_005202 [Rhodosporidiobolus poonsookiae]
MPYKNSYTPPAPLAVEEYHADTPVGSYDLNFCYDLPPLLETKGGVRVEPIIPSVHGPRLYRLFSAHPSGFLYLPYGPFPTYAAFLTMLENARRDPGTLLCVVYDLALDLGNSDEDLREGQTLREERIAGIVGVLKGMPVNRSAEIGHLHIPSPFQRTHVLTHSIVLLLRWLLDPPSPSALGLRRAQWFANSLNRPSISAAERLGFALEATHLAWERVLPPGKDAVALPAFVEGEWRAAEEQRGGGRHSSLLAIGWDLWEETAREKTAALVEREVRRRVAADVPGLLDV